LFYPLNYGDASEIRCQKSEIRHSGAIRKNPEIGLEPKGSTPEAGNQDRQSFCPVQNFL